MKKTIDFSKYSSIKIGPITEVTVIDKCQDLPHDAFIVGGASNLLVSPTPPPLAMLSKRFDFIMIEKNNLHIGAATPSGKIVSFCKRHDIGGFEFLSSLPGKLGGLLAMNAGMKQYEIFDNLVALRTCNGWFSKEEINHGYRFAQIEGVVLEAAFTFSAGFSSDRVASFAQMRSNQPRLPSAGSCFKNPPGDYAGRLIEAAGLKGKRLGAMGWSDVHANFLVNHGGGTYEEALTLITHARSTIQKRFGITLQEEIVIL